MSRRHHTLRTRLVAALIGCVAGLALAACGSGQITQTDAQDAAVDGANGEVGGMAVRNATLAFPAEAEEPASATSEAAAPASTSEASHGGEETTAQAALVNSYPRGADVPLIATFVNTGKFADELVSVSSPVAARTTIEGPARFEPKSAITSSDEVPAPVTGTSASASASASGSASTSASGSASTAPSGASGSVEASAEDSAEAEEGAEASEETSAGTAPSGTGSASASTSASAAGSASAAAPSATTPVPALAEGDELRIVLQDISEPIRAALPVQITFLFREAGELTLELPMGAPEGRGEASVPAGIGPAQIAKIERYEDKYAGKVEDEAIEHWAEENGLSHEEVEKVREERGDGDEAGAEHSSGGGEEGTGGH